MSTIHNIDLTQSNHATLVQRGMEILKTRLHVKQPPGGWLEITQEMVNAFADVVGDHQWIHIDDEPAHQGPFYGPVAHGRFILATLPLMLRRAAPTDNTEIRLDGLKMSLDYGFDRVRFPAPVPVGSRVRASQELTRIEIIGGSTIEKTIESVVEIEGEPQPACVARSLVRLVF